ncbi:family 43 glycosylhydrolase [Rhodopirellula sallentina]|uniref:family 43 glycosylhydrolase n=1 Tax=Rhodopirellula sallentina TaxID=1263869 RepID=UPI0003454A24|nr:family 43 glycosylhydrolase [Rhodopirellula sallentina]
MNYVLSPSRKCSFVVALILCLPCAALADEFKGRVVDRESQSPLAGLTVRLVEDELSTKTDDNGTFQIEASDSDAKTIRVESVGYMFDEEQNVSPNDEIEFKLRKRHESAATIREQHYLANGCEVDNPAKPEWNIAFTSSLLKGDLAPDPTYTRRDPSSVILVDGTYYVWYSYSLTHDTNKIAPWDLNDLYLATSKDGETWKEQGVAVPRGVEGSFDHRSVFTTEIFVHDDVYYLIYQAAADVDGIYNRNVVGMAHAQSPDGPWKKLDAPVLTPTYTEQMFFDNRAVHDPCLIHYRDKFYLYYKGECSCRDNENCRQWCNPPCGLRKQVKWGVAISDSPTGPFEKSPYNPITNTGHEVMVWKYGTGIAILQHQDGPEAKTIQYAEDGLNFQVMGTVKNMPEAAGLFRPNEPDDTPHSGVQWGLSHVLKWNAGPKGWMYIQKYQKVE